jgi:DNA-binding transcriptional ArsR family regulator
MADDFVAVLIEDLRSRLEELEAERAGIKRALRALEHRTSRHGRRDLEGLLIESIRASPGSRASFLALEFGVSASTVAAHLRKLEQSGSVVKRGLGWESSTPNS